MLSEGKLEELVGSLRRAAGVRSEASRAELINLCDRAATSISELRALRDQAAGPSGDGELANLVAERITNELDKVPKGRQRWDQTASDIVALVTAALRAQAPADPMEAWVQSIPFAPWLWADPAHDPTGPERVDLAMERLKAPYVRAQPFTPSQYALVLRWDIGTVTHELIWRRAQVEMYQRERAQAPAPVAEAAGRPGALQSEGGQ